MELTKRVEIVTMYSEFTVSPLELVNDKGALHEHINDQLANALSDAICNNIDYGLGVKKVATDIETGEETHRLYVNIISNTEVEKIREMEKELNLLKMENLNIKNLNNQLESALDAWDKLGQELEGEK